MWEECQCGTYSSYGIQCGRDCDASSTVCSTKYEKSRQCGCDEASSMPVWIRRRQCGCDGASFDASVDEKTTAWMWIAASLERQRRLLLIVVMLLMLDPSVLEGQAVCGDDLTTNEVTRGSSRASDEPRIFQQSSRWNEN